MRTVWLLAIASCGKSDAPARPTVHESAAPSSETPAPANARQNDGSAAVRWPTIDRSTFLTVQDLSVACGVNSSTIRMDADTPEDPPLTDAIGVQRAVYGAGFGRRSQPDRDHFMGISVQAYDSAEHEDAAFEAFAKEMERYYTRVPGSNLLTHRLEQDRYVRREVWGSVGRYGFSLFETEPEGTPVICNDDALLHLARLIDGRLR